MKLISITDVCKEYVLGKIRVQALLAVNFELQEGEFVSICGPSGSGKTTFLNIVGCLDCATRGSVQVMGEEVKNLSDRALSSLRNKYFGFVFQTFNLIPVLSAFENIEYPLQILGLSAAERRKKTAKILEEVGLTEFRKHKPDELSGGQRQRVAIARALVTNPKLVLADEPTANLDHVTGKTILELMKKMNRERRTTFLFSTHDPEIMKYAQKIFHLRDGKMAEKEFI